MLNFQLLWNWPLLWIKEWPFENPVLADRFTQKNLRQMVFTMFIITDTIQVPTITDEINPLQTGGVFSWRAKLTGAQYKHRVLYT